jgi:hypothetical protein
MWKAPEAALPQRPLRPFYRWLALGANIILAVSALAWVMLVSPHPADPVVPQVAHGEKYDSAVLRQLISADLRAAQRQCNTKTLRELLLLLQIG